MKIDGKAYRTIWLGSDGKSVEIIDQTKLPHKFATVTLRGLFGSPRYMELFDEERRTLARLLARDPLRLRRAVPMALRRKLYDAMLRRHRHADDPRALAITSDDFELRDDGLDTALDLFAICSGPR